MTTAPAPATAAKQPFRPLQVERLLQINVTTLVVLSTLLLATGQGNPLYAILSLAVAITAVFVTDFKGYFQLGPAAANAAAAGVCVILVLQIIQNRGESQLLNVANTLIFLEIILLFQKKEERTYWSLMALSLLQVIVAAALNLGILFSLLLGCYLLAAISALTLFFVLRETQPFATAPDSSPSAEPSGQRSAPSAPESDLAGGILNRSYIRRLTRMIAMTALATIFAFFAIPRFSNSVWETPQPGQITSTGFTEEVQLDDIGRILESPEQVMRVEFATLQGLPYDVVGEPYFRGTVLSDYKGDGSWRQFRSTRANRPFQLQRGAFDLAHIVSQKYTLQPRPHSILFHVAPGYPVDMTPEGLILNAHTRQLSLPSKDDGTQGTYRYELGTTAFRNGWQRDLLPLMQDLRYIAGNPALSQLYDPEYWQQNFPAITGTAAGVIADQQLANAPLLERIKALEGHFRSSGLYRYSLEINQSRDQDLDPIEDFVRNHRTGHCEYFASALTLMLRSQGIPARMVVGYKGGELNTVGRYYIVRQLHAHAWVEAYLPPEEIPTGDLDSIEDRELGAWLRLDPTPSGTDVVANRQRLILVTKARELLDYCQVLWDDYVLGLNASRQRQAIYRPILQSMRSLVKTIGSGAVWRERIRNWHFSIWHLLTLAGVTSTLILLRKRVRRWCTELVDTWRKRRRRARQAFPRVDFYDRLTKILARSGLRREPQQTPQEFAATAAHRLAELAPASPVTGIPPRVTDAFYRVRFGGQAISAEEQLEIQHALADLDQALR